MANKAFQIARELRRRGTNHSETLDALRKVNTHPCVIDEVWHRLQRENGGTNDVQVIGFDWRRRHGLGRKLAYGLGGRARMLSKRQIERETKRVHADRLRYGDEVTARISFRHGADIASVVAAAMLGLRRFIGRKQ